MSRINQIDAYGLERYEAGLAMGKENADKALKSENDQLRGVLSLILIYPNVGKHLGSELINLAHAALGTKETQQP